jgi:transposase InsO family protein
MYLSTILDDFSRYVVAWKLCSGMTSRDVSETLELALQASGCDQADWLSDNGMSHVRGAPYHPQTQGKIERWHQTLKNRMLLENYFLPGDLEKQIELFVDHYNHQRYHESLKNLTPADVYFGRGQSILAKRERIKKRTIAKRRLHYQRHAA